MQAEADPNLIVYFNSQYIPLSEARVGILTHALHYGTGAFEGIRAYWNADLRDLYALRVVEHFERWRRNCSILHIHVPATPQQLADISIELLRRNHITTDAYIRPIAYKCAERIGVCPDEHDAFAIIALPFGDYLHAEKGLHVGVSSWRRVEDNAIPARAKICGAYVNSVLATDEARRNGFDEAIFLNEDGHVAEGSACNLFMVRNGNLITPPVYENVLEGITRDAIIQMARRELGMEAIERPIDRSELFICDELFFTGTAVGIAPIVRVNHRSVASGAIGPITQHIRQLYTDAVHGCLHPYQNWLTPVYHPHVDVEQDLHSRVEVSIG